MSQPGIERRKAPRATAEFQIQVSDRGTTRAASIKDLSTNGLCCTYSEPLREMTMVELGLQLPGDSVLHSVQGAVVRCAKLRDVAPPTYEVAIYFTSIEPDTRTALGAFVGAQTA